MNAAARSMKSTARVVARGAGRVTSGSRMLPDFLIIGVQRAGTTSLYRALSGHPDVVRPALNKGIHYFDTADRYARGPAWYRAQFPLRALANRRSRSGRAVTGEASPYYAFHPLAAERIARELPTTRLVLLLRDPVERAYSAWKQEHSRGFETESFERALELEPKRLAGEVERMRAEPDYQSFHHQHHAYVERGRYANQIRALRSHVGPERLFVVESDDILTPDHPSWSRLLDFLDLPPWTPPVVPTANARPSAPLDAALRARLRSGYADADAELADVLGTVPSWRR